MKHSDVIVGEAYTTKIYNDRWWVRVLERTNDSAGRVVFRVVTGGASPQTFTRTAAQLRPVVKKAAR